MRLSATIERWPVAGSFTISRGAKTFVDVVVVIMSDGEYSGRGESTPIYYLGETAESVVARIQALDPAIVAEGDLSLIQQALPKGAARNAVDAALRDLLAKRTGMAAWAMAGMRRPEPAVTAYTLSLADPATTETAARLAAPHHPLLKLKLSGSGDVLRVAAARRGAPEARLIVEANESWTGRDVRAEASALLEFGVEMIEQPVRAGEDHLLDGVESPIPLCADESCHDRDDLARCIGRYAAINIKLDKAGGLGEAAMLAADAKSAGLEIMVGCMLSTSLGIAPAFVLAAQARWADLDGPLLLASDRPGGFRFGDGMIHPATPGFWG